MHSHVNAQFYYFILHIYSKTMFVLIYLLRTGSWGSEHCGLGNISSDRSDSGKILQKLPETPEVVGRLPHRLPECRIRARLGRVGHWALARPGVQILYIRDPPNSSHHDFHFHHNTGKSLFLPSVTLKKLIREMIIQDLSQVDVRLVGDSDVVSLD